VSLTLPNLAPYVLDLFLYRGFVYDPAVEAYVEGPPILFFDTRTHNTGTVPLDLTLDDLTHPETSTVSQCVSWTTEGSCRSRRVVGGFEWDAAAVDFKFAEFTTSELRRLGADGRPDYSDVGLIAAVDRTLPCFYDESKVDDGESQVPLYKPCSLLRQGVTPGWRASYDPRHEEDQLPMTGLADGRYGLVIHLDYNRHLFDADTRDNVQEVIVEVSDGAHRATVVSRTYPGVPPT
jgi:hypothetical protein